MTIPNHPSDNQTPSFSFFTNFPISKNGPGQQKFWFWNFTMENSIGPGQQKNWTRSAEKLDQVSKNIKNVDPVSKNIVDPVSKKRIVHAPLGEVPSEQKRKSL